MCPLRHLWAATAMKRLLVIAGAAVWLVVAPVIIGPYAAAVIGTVAR
jgi:hypothetical protein